VNFITAVDCDPNLARALSCCIAEICSAVSIIVAVSSSSLVRQLLEDFSQFGR
jgi:hypothetical protein